MWPLTIGSTATDPTIAKVVPLRNALADGIRMKLGDPFVRSLDAFGSVGIGGDDLLFVLSLPPTRRGGLGTGTAGTGGLLLILLLLPKTVVPECTPVGDILHRDRIEVHPLETKFLLDAGVFRAEATKHEHDLEEIRQNDLGALIPLELRAEVRFILDGGCVTHLIFAQEVEEINGGVEDILVSKLLLQDLHLEEALPQIFIVLVGEEGTGVLPEGVD